MGGSAIASDLCASLYADSMPHPLVTVRDYHWPAWVTPASLVLLSSYSGDTDETLALYREASERGIPRVAMTTGGTLARHCARDGVPFVKLPGGRPPRAALFSSWVALTRLLHALGWVDDPAASWSEAVRELEARNRECGPSVPEPDNPAKRMARSLAGRFVIIYCGSERLAPVAIRMRNQLNENAKLLGHSGVVPELNHNEIVGWEKPGPLEGRLAVLILRDAEDSPEVAIRLTITGEYAERGGARVVEADGGAAGRLARMASLVQFGDYLSLYLALSNGVDPTPIASIDELKRRLSEWGAQRAR